MKKCTNCKEEKSEEHFAWKNKAKGLRQNKCKICYSAYNRTYYHSGEKHKQKARVRANIEKTAQKYRAWKDLQSCNECDESAAECLDLHHLDPTKKDFSLSGSYQMYTWERIQKELHKCVVLCANCHRKVHTGRIQILDP